MTMKLKRSAKQLLAAASLALTLTTGVLPAMGLVPSAYAGDAFCSGCPMAMVFPPLPASHPAPGGDSN